MKKFVVFEGIDGSGKTTICNRVYGELRKKGIEVVKTSEPFNKNIKRCIDDFLSRNADPLTIAMLFIADRIEHSKIIEKWLSQGKIVICDRYEDSTYAYQGAQLENKIENAINYLKNLTPNNILHPDRVFVLDVEPNVAISRLKGKRELANFEKLDFLEKVRKNYLYIAKGDDRYRIVDATKSIEEMVNICLEDMLGDRNENRDKKER